MSKKSVAKKTKSVKTKKKELKFKYVIPDHVRDCYVTGAWGGLLKHGQLHMHLFNERAPIPNHVKIEVSDDGSAKELEVDRGGDFVRIVQASIVMDLPAVIALRDWLDGMIANFEDTLPEDVKEKFHKISSGKDE